MNVKLTFENGKGSRFRGLKCREPGFHGDISWQQPCSGLSGVTPKCPPVLSWGHSSSEMTFMGPVLGVPCKCEGRFFNPKVPLDLDLLIKKSFQAAASHQQRLLLFKAEVFQQYQPWKVKKSMQKSRCVNMNLPGCWLEEECAVQNVTAALWHPQRRGEHLVCKDQKKKKNKKIIQTWSNLRKIYSLFVLCSPGLADTFGSGPEKNFSGQEGNADGASPGFAFPAQSVSWGSVAPNPTQGWPGFGSWWPPSAWWPCPGVPCEPNPSWAGETQELSIVPLSKSLHP